MRNTGGQTGIAVLSPAKAEASIDGLTGLLLAAVLDGASIGFVLPFTRADSEAFWRYKVLPDITDGNRTLLAAYEAGQIVGTVQLSCGTMPNQAHRADVNKLIVHPAFRRRGIAKALMCALEEEAHRLGRTLITLDTRTGDNAEPLYSALGYETAGIIPDYARDVRENRLDATTLMFKRLGETGAVTPPPQ